MVKDIAQALHFLHTKGWLMSHQLFIVQRQHVGVSLVMAIMMCFSAGIAHRDLKLENVLCEYTDQVVGESFQKFILVFKECHFKVKVFPVLPLGFPS